MKKKPILLLSLAATACAVVGLASCGVNEAAVMQQKDAISICFDCNGGSFANTKDVTFYDVIPLKNFSTVDGEKKITLVAPGDGARGDKGKELSMPSYTGYFLAGWYEERIPRVDANGNPLDEDGNLTSVSNKPQGYSYADKWDFDSDQVVLDASKEYTAETSIITLYAAWIPNFSYQFMTPKSYEDDGVTVKEWEEKSVTAFNPLVQDNTLKMPTVDEKTGGYKNNSFPTIFNKTFECAYADAELTELWTETTTHNGYVDEATGTAVQPRQTVYTLWKEGTWYEISNVAQFNVSASAVGYYELKANLDYTGQFWPYALSSTRFNGAIYGNGFTISNVSIEQSQISDIYGGLFGALGEKAVLENITFENVTYTLKTGSRMPDAKFGLLAGENNSTSLTGVSVTGSLKISDELYDNAKDGVSYANYSIGLLFALDLTSGANTITQTITHEVYVATQNAENTKQPSITATLDEDDGTITLAKATAQP